MTFVGIVLLFGLSKAEVQNTACYATQRDRVWGRQSAPGELGSDATVILHMTTPSLDENALSMWGPDIDGFHKQQFDSTFVLAREKAPSIAKCTLPVLAKAECGEV
ncbi:hypothetical protein RUND412_009910 [Rhizina undulata]